jgi:DNA-binding MarR family transcriptional regulator
MSLQKELGFIHPMANRSHEAIINIVLTGTLLAKEADRIFRPLRLTDSQFNVLMILKHQSRDGQMSQTTLGNMLVVNRSNVTGLIDRMERAGRVERAADPEDRRVNLVRLTVAGRRLLERAERAYFARIEEITGALPADEQGRLCRMLEHVRGNLRGEEDGESRK